ncbi:hypothetical protein [Staphylococcus gallinarum]|uniref:hypothetical protein n=1 Tax=Staphylococcus gallinarum TaxID=1293 RepID=UPI00398B4355
MIKSLSYKCYGKSYVLLVRFPRGQLQPVVFSLSCSLRSLTKIRPKNCDATQKNTVRTSF